MPGESQFLITEKMSYTELKKNKEKMLTSITIVEEIWSNFTCHKGKFKLL